MSLGMDCTLSKIELVMCSESTFNSTFTVITKECSYKMHCLIETNFK
jgi:hypothetical protein